MKSGKTVTILALETSCDETAAAVLTGTIKSEKPQFQISSSVVRSQMAIHRNSGGVIPEIAARAHVQSILPVTQAALKQAQLTLADLDYIAVTAGPGLIVSLIVGVEFAKGLSLALDKAMIPTNHMAGHLYSAFGADPAVKFPVLSIVVSGGHTMLVVMTDYKKYKVIGQTVDDAAGEAFDKIAKLLGLGYPGGPEISKLALQGKTDFLFPRPMLHTKDYEFSFSGLKTAVKNFVASKKLKAISYKLKADIALSFETAVADVLVSKAMRAVKEYRCKSVSLSGGVAANRRLREVLAAACRKANVKLIVPDFRLCTDNAEMIALAAYFKLRAGFKPVSFRKIQANPNWEL